MHVHVHTHAHVCGAKGQQMWKKLSGYETEVNQIYVTAFYSHFFVLYIYIYFKNNSYDHSSEYDDCMTF